MRGLVPAERLEAALAAAPGTAQELLDELVAQGILDEEDLEILKGLARQGHSAAASGASESSRDEGLPVASGNGISSGSSGGAGRKVLRQQSEASWGPYRNLRFIGEGGMGRIFKAYDPVLKRTVALKLLRHEDPALIERFTLEAQHQARVEHPNIAKVFAVGEWEGQPYLALQFIRGETLESLEAKLSLEAKVRVMEQVAEAVHAAHRQGLIHRDLKPANIMVEREGDSLVPFVLDFGLARGVESTGQTLQGAVMGTMHYMAPEQARGALDQIGRQTDVYGLGATLHRLLTGRPPFFEGQGLDVARLTLEEELPSLRKLNPELPEDLDLLVRKCMEKDPVNRYVNALEVAEELHRWLSGEPLRVQKPSLGYVTSKWVRRHRLVVAVAATGLLALLVVVGISLKGRLDLRKQAAHAQYFGQEAERIEALVRYSQMLPAHDIRPDLAQIQARMRRMESEWRASGKLAEGPLAYALGRVQLKLGNPDAALTQLERAQRLGFQAPELDYALGKVRMEKHRKARRLLGLIKDPELRADRERALDREQKDILERLLAGGPSSLDPFAYQEANLALMHGDWGLARAKARQAFSEAPWFFEALALEAQACLDQARREKDRQKAQSLLDEAGALGLRARALAPSDPGLMALEAERMMLSPWLELDPSNALSGLASALDGHFAAWEKLNPEDPLQLGQRALSEAVLGLHAIAGGRRESPGFWAGRSLAHAQVALDRNPTQAEALLARVMAYRVQLSQDFNTGEALSLPLDGLLEAGQAALNSAPQDLLVLESVSVMLGMAVSFPTPETMPTLVRGIDRLLPPGTSRPDLMAARALVLVELADRRFQEGEDPRPQIKESLALIGASQDAALPTQKRTGLGLMAWYMLAVYQDRLGQDPRAAIQAGMAVFRVAIRAFPDRHVSRWAALELMLLKAEWDARLGVDPAPALAEAKALRLGLGRTHPDLWVVPWAEAKAHWIEGQGRDKGRLAQALKLLDAAAIRNPREAQIPLLQAELLQETGRPEAALRCLEAYLKREPRRFWVKQALEQLRARPGASLRTGAS